MKQIPSSTVTLIHWSISDVTFEKAIIQKLPSKMFLFETLEIKISDPIPKGYFRKLIVFNTFYTIYSYHGLSIT